MEQKTKNKEQKFSPHKLSEEKEYKNKSFFGKNSDGKKSKKDELAEIEGKYKRALADYQNLLKRTAIEKREYVKYANEQLLYEILPVYDNLKLALRHSDKTPNGVNAVIEGVKYVLSQFKTILDNLGVKEIKTVGEKFDHHTMEAIEKKETDDKNKDGVVESEVMSGYRLGDKVIRAARVVVYEFKK